MRLYVRITCDVVVMVRMVVGRRTESRVQGSSTKLVGERHVTVS
jgi:hypothetical protein